MQLLYAQSLQSAGLVTLYCLTHVAAAVISNYVSHENHLRPMVMVLIGLCLGIPGLFLVHYLNNKHGAEMKAEARAMTINRKVHPTFGEPKPPEEASEPPPPTQIQAAGAFTVPKQLQRDDSNPGDGQA